MLPGALGAYPDDVAAETAAFEIGDSEQHSGQPAGCADDGRGSHRRYMVAHHLPHLVEHRGGVPVEQPERACARPPPRTTLPLPHGRRVATQQIRGRPVKDCLIPYSSALFQPRTCHRAQCSALIAGLLLPCTVDAVKKTQLVQCNAGFCRAHLQTGWFAGTCRC